MSGGAIIGVTVHSAVCFDEDGKCECVCGLDYLERLAVREHFDDVEDRQRADESCHDDGD